MEGAAVFSPLDDKSGRLHYSEKGFFNKGVNAGEGAPHRVTEFYQNYLYAFEGANRFSIYFVQEGRGKFMTFDGATKKTSSSTHLCQNDHYTGFFERTSDNAFILIYDVLGPSKNYRSVTYYARR